MIGKDSQTILLDSIGKIFSSVVLNQRQKRDICSPYVILVFERKQIKIVHIGKILSVSLPVVCQMCLII